MALTHAEVESYVLRVRGKLYGLQARAGNMPELWRPIESALGDLNELLWEIELDRMAHEGVLEFVEPEAIA